MELNELRAFTMVAEAGSLLEPACANGRGKNMALAVVHEARGRRHPRLNGLSVSAKYNIGGGRLKQLFDLNFANYLSGGTVGRG